MKAATAPAPSSLGFPLNMYPALGKNMYSYFVEIQQREGLKGINIVLFKIVFLRVLKNIY